MTYYSLILLLPLLGAAFAGLFGRYFRALVSYVVTSTCIGTAAILSLFLLRDILIVGHYVTIEFFPWFTVGDLHLAWSMRMDIVSVMMCAIVTTISATVHVYSIGYMAQAKGRIRFAAYISLFTFFMLFLVVSNDMLQLFAGWEGVGLASYLLIGFDHERDSANDAAIKAFVVNRIGDLFLIIAIMGMYALFGSLTFDDILGHIPEVQEKFIHVFGMDIHVLSIIAFLCFVGCMGKSAQLVLHVWLPDAMEGPTPVSALIHAATMVTAGVFLVIRLSFMFEACPYVLAFITVVGALTAIFAATVGMTQYDIKRVTAYSTCSQLGFMFMGLGMSAYTGAFFHLMTHAFFKSLLFLGCGSVIHAVHTQDMRAMGNLWHKLPITHGVMFVGAAALSGIPFFAGAYSKDILMDVAWGGRTWIGDLVYILSCCAIAGTAFYTWRMMYNVFYRSSKRPQEAQEKLHEPSYTMLGPLLFLGIGSAVMGKLGFGFFIDHAKDYWGQTIATHTMVDHLKSEGTLTMMRLMPKAFLIVGLLSVWGLYVFKPAVRAFLKNRFSSLYQFIYNKWYFDVFYERTIIKFYDKMAHFFSDTFERGVIDRFGPNGLSTIMIRTGDMMRRLQTGYIYQYAFFMMLAVVLILFGYSVNIF